MSEPLVDESPTVGPVTASSSAADDVVVIEPTRGWVSLRFGDLWRYRELLYFLVWRDVKVRYKQTLLGAVWAILQPTATMIIFSIFMGKLAKIPSDSIPYPLFVFSGLLPWQLFSFALVDSSNSLVANKQLITKVFFPRLIVPTASIVTGLVDFGAASLVLIVLMIHYRVMPTTGLVFLPLLLLFALMAALAIGLWLSALNVQYRDVRYTIPFLTQLWLFATPIAYPSSLIPERWRYIYGLNPIAGVVEGFRWALFGTTPHLGPLMGVSVATVVLLLIGGLAYFRHMEKYFADLV
jgi:lipopolysaccharide transport system permease protein